MTLNDHISDVEVPWPDENIVERSFYYRVYKDNFPITPGHLLFIPTFSTQSAISEAFNAAYHYGEIKVENGEWDAYNIGMNCGAAAGQTVMWPHIHLVPRRTGDVENPRGGVRNFLQNGLGDYLSPKLRPDGGN